MTKPDKCKMHVKHCESCEDWEPIPFHDKGGLCLGSRKPMRLQLTADYLRRSAKASTRDLRVAAGIR